VSYFVIRHDLVDSYLSAHWDHPGRRWAKFDSHSVKQFASKDAALMVVDTMFPGCLVVEVIESNIDAVAQAIVEGMRENILEDIAALGAKLQKAAA